MNKPRGVVTIVSILIVLFSNFINAQAIGTFASAVWLSDCSQDNFFNTSGSVANLIGPSGNTFQNANLGVYTQNSGKLILRGAQVKTFKNPASSTVCNVKMYYRVYLQTAIPGTFNSIDISFLEDCSGPAGPFPSGGPCQPGDQKWQRIIPDGATIPYPPVNLTSNAAGNYVLEIYYEVSGSLTTTTLCNDIITLDNSGNNYKAFFTIQSPALSSTNPSTCNGAEGSITISGLSAGSSYQLSYIDDGVNVGPLTVNANGSGQIIITGLNAGLYTNFVLGINGCSTNLNTGIILSNPIYVPFFNSIAPFCAGTTPPVLPTTSNNGLMGTWSPAVVDNQNSGTYTFSSAGQCGVPATISITVIPRVTPTFSFGTSLVICSAGTVPSLPSTSTNGITGTWNPSVVDNQNSGTYTFTPNSGQCANGTNFTVTVNPNITPVFGFGTSATICAGGAVPTLPASSSNGLTGTWSPSVVDNQNSGTYTFTPNAGQCATTATFTETVNPNLTPVFSFGTSLSICAGTAAPVLPTTSNNGITGAWNPAVADNQNTGNYTFTPNAGQCALPATVTITVTPKPTPAFPFGTSLSVCTGGTVPILPTTSTNGITGTWNPSVVDNTNTGIYTFIPSVGQCANNTTFTVRVNPILTPNFSFGNSLTICAGGTVPILPGTSANSIIGTWSPSIVDNQNSGTYTFTPGAGQCATGTTFTVTVNPNLSPVFSFGTNLSICAGGTVPVLPTTSINGISGSWNPSVVNNQATASYIFTATSAPCVAPYVYTVTVNPIITPAFPFGTFQSVCIGSVPPVLPTTSTDGIAGMWSPSIVDNQVNGTYTFTPSMGQCAVATTLTYEVNPIPSVTVRSDTSVYDGAILPAFNFTTSAGGAVQWTNSNPSIGLAAGGTGNVPSFKAVNMTNDPVTGTVTATPFVNGCLGTPKTYVVTVLPLNKDVFVPNVFSPNGDGKNDLLYVYGTYIDKIEMRIFNQWGQEIAIINNKAQGWDGRYKGTPQPVGVYVYILKASLSTGKNVTLKGSITIIR